jgi:hypothetical protein
MHLQWWKWPQIAKGALTWIPPLDAWRKRRLSTGGTDNPRYCYSVWLRHLVTLKRCGFDAKGARNAELGHGDSIGTRLAALLSGAAYYVGLDVVAFLPRNAGAIFEHLVKLYRAKAPIPDDTEFPRVGPKIGSYEFPDHVMDWSGFEDRVSQIRKEIREGLQNGRMVSYHAPWTSVGDVASRTLDLVFSQAVLEYAPVNEAYTAMSAWLKEGRYASHVIDLSAHYLSPFSNGHWAYSDWEWRLACGRREASLNREPLSTHLACASKHGFEILLLHKNSATNGLKPEQLSVRFRTLDADDLQTRGATLVLRKIAK